MKIKNGVLKVCSFPSKITFHSFGFTEAHDFQMLQAVTMAGNAGSGLYYSFTKMDDIAPAIGDCLGVVSKVVAYPIYSFLSLSLAIP